MRFAKKHKKVAPKNHLHLVICEKVPNFAIRKWKIIKTINKIR